MFICLIQSILAIIKIIWDIFLRINPIRFKLTYFSVYCLLQERQLFQFRSDRPTYGSYSPKQTSPTSPQPLYDNVSGAKDAKGSPSRLDYLQRKVPRPMSHNWITPAPLKINQRRKTRKTKRRSPRKPQIKRR